MNVRKLSDDWKQCMDVCNAVKKEQLTLQEAAGKLGISYTAASTRLRAWELRKKEYDLLKDYSAQQVIAMLPAINVNLLITECGITPDWSVRQIKMAAGSAGAAYRRMNIAAINGLDAYQGDFIRIDGRIYPITEEEAEKMLEILGGE